MVQGCLPVGRGVGTQLACVDWSAHVLVAPAQSWRRRSSLVPLYAHPCEKQGALWTGCGTRGSLCLSVLRIPTCTGVQRQPLLCRLPHIIAGDGSHFLCDVQTPSVLHLNHQPVLVAFCSGACTFLSSPSSSHLDTCSGHDEAPMLPFFP